MGLDMYVYSVKKPGLDLSKVYDRNDLDDIVIGEADIELPMIRQLLPYCAKIRVVNHYYDLEKIGADYGLKDVHVGGWSCDSNGMVTRFYGEKEGRSESVAISDNEVDSKYTIDQEETCYVCEKDEMRYWRKAYDVQDWFHENIQEPVENTGYYILTAEMLAAFNQAFPDDTLPVEAPDNDSALVYWEWY